MSHSKLSIGGFNLGYSIEGKGEAALVVGSSVYYPRIFSKNLRSYLRMIFMDHRGFAPSPDINPSDTSQFDMDRLIDDIEVLRKKLKLERFIIIGHSGHGHIALEYAKKHPEAVSHVVIIAMSPDSSPASFAAADQYLNESVCPERKALLAENMKALASDIKKDPAARFIAYSLRSGARIWYDYKFDAQSLWQDVKIIPEMFEYVWSNAFKTIDITKNLDKLNDKPVLLMLGRYDYWNPPYLWQPIKLHFKSLTVRVFEKSGHAPQLEEPEAFDSELLQWLGIGITPKPIAASKARTHNREKLAKSLRTNLLRRKAQQTKMKE